MAVREPLDPEFPGPVAQEIVEIDTKRSRVLLSSRIMSEISWLAKGTAMALGILDQPNIIRLASFEKYGEVVIKRRRELINSAHTPEVLEALILFEDRYHRIKIPQDRRVTLSNALFAHLEIQGGPEILYIERVLDEIRLVSPKARVKRIGMPIKQFDDLP